VDVWFAGLSTDPMDPISGDLFATDNRTLAFVWLAGALLEFEGADPYITEVHKALDGGLDGVVVSFHSPEPDGDSSGIYGEDDVKGFVTHVTLTQIPVPSIESLT